MSDGFLIIGAGGFGREVLEYAFDAHSAGSNARPLGFLDDAKKPLRGRNTGGVGVVAKTSDIGSLSVSNYVIALGDPETRMRMRRAIEASGGSLVSIIHPTAHVSPSAQIGSGCVLAPFSLAAAFSQLGDNVAMNVYASVGHDAAVGDDSVIGPYSGTTGESVLGQGCYLGAQAVISPRVQIGPWSKVSAGAVVGRNAPGGSLSLGNPAKSRVMFQEPK